MPFGVKIGVDGQPVCPCCRDTMLHHCKRCWDKYHNGKMHHDYIEPEYYGQRMGGFEQVEKEMEKEMGIPPKKKIIIKDKDRKYEEGMYGH